VLPAVTNPPYDARLLISNPGETDATVDVTLLGPDGMEAQTSVTVPARRTVLVPTAFTNREPLAAVQIHASQGQVVPVAVGYSLDHQAYAVSAGVPIPR
jgi:hypothetical protein